MEYFTILSKIEIRFTFIIFVFLFNVLFWWLNISGEFDLEFSVVVESPVSQGVNNYGRIFENILNLYIEKCKLEGYTQILPKSPVTTELGEGGVSDYIAIA